MYVRPGCLVDPFIFCVCVLDLLKYVLLRFIDSDYPFGIFKLICRDPNKVVVYYRILCEI